MLSYVRFSSLLVMAISLVAVGYTLDDLQNGPGEALSHWWSTAPLLSILAASLAWLGSAARDRR